MTNCDEPDTSACLILVLTWSDLRGVDEGLEQKHLFDTGPRQEYLGKVLALFDDAARSYGSNYRGAQ